MGITGMESQAFEYFMERLCHGQNVSLTDCFAHSECLSADVTNAYDPTYKEVCDKRNNSRINGGNVAEKCFLLEKRSEENVSIISFCRSAQSRSWPSLLRRISASRRLAHSPTVVMACFAEAVSNWTVIQFSN